MNDLYTRDRMERNKQDFEGSGIGSGRYDSRQERIEKWDNMKLPLVLGVFLVIMWIVLLYISIPDFRYYSSGTKVLVEAEIGSPYWAKWEAPDGKIYDVSIREAGIKASEGKSISIYYLGEDYENAKVLTPIAEWVMFYGFAILCTLALGLWMTKILFQKHRAVVRQKEHSYKDY